MQPYPQAHEPAAMHELSQLAACTRAVQGKRTLWLLGGPCRECRVSAAARGTGCCCDRAARQGSVRLGNKERLVCQQCKQVYTRYVMCRDTHILMPACTSLHYGAVVQAFSGAPLALCHNDGQSNLLQADPRLAALNSCCAAAPYLWPGKQPWLRSLQLPLSAFHAWQCCR